MRWCLLALAWFAFASQGEAMPPWYSEGWARLRANMGPIDFDGRLYLSSPIGRFAADGVGWPLSIEPSIDLDADEVPSSRWQVAGLAAFIVPEGRAGLRAKLPNGRILHFSANPGGARAVPDANGAWLLSGDGRDFDLTSPEANHYLFHDGQLVRLRTRLGAILEIAAEGGHIRSVRRAGDSGPALLRCDYDPTWNPTEIEEEGRAVASLRWRDGLLEEWSAPDGPATRIEYTNRLVTGIRRGRGRAIAIAWAKVPDWPRWSDIWWSPVRVSRFGTLRFRYDLGHDGDTFTVVDRATGEKTVTRFNWITRTIVQRAGEAPAVTATYDTGLVRPGYFLSLRRGDGVVLEEYTYGADRRLVRIRKRRPDGSYAELAGRDQILRGWDGEPQPGMPIYER